MIIFGIWPFNKKTPLFVPDLQQGGFLTSIPLIQIRFSWVMCNTLFTRGRDPVYRDIRELTGRADANV